MQNSFEHFKNLVKDDLENLYVDNYRIDAEELKSTKNPNIFENRKKIFNLLNIFNIYF